jgi:hypothetical protein
MKVPSIYTITSRSEEREHSLSTLSLPVGKHELNEPSGSPRRACMRKIYQSHLHAPVRGFQNQPGGPKDGLRPQPSALLLRFTIAQITSPLLLRFQLLFWIWAHSFKNLPLIWFGHVYSIRNGAINKIANARLMCSFHPSKTWNI